MPPILTRCTDLRDEVLDRWGNPIRNVVLLGRSNYRQPDSRNRRQRLKNALGRRGDNILLPGLRRMCETAKPGECFSLSQIAKECNTSKQFVHKVERAAMRKLRDKLAKKFGTGLSTLALRRALLSVK